MRIRTILVAAIALCALATTSPAQISYPRFDPINDLRPIGAVMITGGAAAMTYGGAMQTAALWSGTREDVAGGFTTTFAFRVGGQVGGILHPDRTRGADGFAFVIHNSSPDAIGGTGHCLGYEGITNSVAVEFDTWRNPDCGDPNGNHVSVQTRGLLFNSAHHAYSLGLAADIPDLSDGKMHVATITYTPGVMTVTVDNAPPLVAPIDLPSTLNLDNGRAWVGFTSATGRAWEQHDILSWTFGHDPAAPGGARRSLR